mgnify:FL=1
MATSKSTLTVDGHTTLNSTYINELKRLVRCDSDSTALDDNCSMYVSGGVFGTMPSNQTITLPFTSEKGKDLIIVNYKFDKLTIKTQASQKMYKNGV